MSVKNDLTFSYVKECLFYNPDTGVLTWNHRPREHFKTDALYKIFISKCAGKVAGWVTSFGYINIRINGRAYKAHRLAWLLSNGKWPDNFIDHINGDRADNRLCNLRDVDKFQNAQNIARPSNNTLGFIGVAKVSKGVGYRAQIFFRGESIHLDRFLTIEEAVEAREKAQIELGFHENHGR